MRKIFGSRRSSFSSNNANSTTDSSSNIPRKVPPLNFEILHYENGVNSSNGSNGVSRTAGSSTNGISTNYLHGANRVSYHGNDYENDADSKVDETAGVASVGQRNEFDDSSTYNDSVLLSDTETLHNEKTHRLELQDTYDENFTSYLPYVLQQFRLEQRMHRNLEPQRATGSSTVTGGQFPLYLEHDFGISDVNDDLPTIIGDSADVDSPVGLNLILNKNTCRFNLKREFLIVNEFFKSATYIFLGKNSFERYKHLRSYNQKKLSKNQVFLYDAEGTIKKVSNINRNEFEEFALPDVKVDKRSHIIPIDSKIKGMGLPLFKVQVPYLSTFRRSTPLVIFKRYREVPLKPVETVEDPDNDFETYTFCTVNSKHFQRVRRFTFNFHLETNESFKVIMFMNNFRPFSDFNYNNTRFRVVGTPVASGYVNLNTPLKILIIDDDKPSLCDNMINKRSTGFVSLITKRGTQAQEEVVYDVNDPTTFPNPFPDPTNPIMDEDVYVDSSAKSYYFSKNLPPFGLLKTLETWDPTLKIPKKYSELAKIEMYQDSLSVDTNLDSTLSIDVDSLVMCCIMTTLREVVVRIAYKVPPSRVAMLTEPVAFVDQSFFATGPL